MQPRASTAPMTQGAGLPGKPSRSFLVSLAACGFSGALLLTPSIALPSATLGDVVASAATLSAPLAPRLAAQPTSFSEPLPVPDSADLEREVVAQFASEPLARLLRRHARAPETAARVARAIVHEAAQLQVAPSLLTGVLLTENARLDARSVSSQGAIGLMQVMSFHAGEFGCGSDDLLQVESNICHGARVFGGYLKRSGDVRRALLRYNGCVRGAHTPNCFRYPTKVLRTAHQVRRQILLYAPAGAWYRAIRAD